MFTPEQVTALSADLNVKHVKQRSQSGRQLSYIEGWHAIAEANRIFGFGGWERATIEMKCVAEKPREIGSRKDPGWAVTYTAKVRVAVAGRDGQPGLVREGYGAGHGIDRDLGLAHESALKEAETDAMKRALMTFGNPFGLALYDKAQAHVSNCEPEAPPAVPPPQPPDKRDEFIASVNVDIDQVEDDILSDRTRLNKWWESVRTECADYGLELADINQLKMRLIARRDALKGKKAA